MAEIVNLFEIMGKEVEKHVEHYKTDYYKYDVPDLLRVAKTGQVYYWLLRECGTNLYRYDRLTIQNEYWSVLPSLEFYKGSYKKLYKIEIAANNSKTLRGTIEPVGLNETVNKLKLSLKNPSSLIVIYGEDRNTFNFDQVDSPKKLLEAISALYKKNLEWEDFNYYFVS